MSFNIAWKFRSEDRWNCVSRWSMPQNSGRGVQSSCTPEIQPVFFRKFLKCPLPTDHWYGTSAYMTA